MCVFHGLSLCARVPHSATIRDGRFLWAAAERKERWDSVVAGTGGRLLGQGGANVERRRRPLAAAAAGGADSGEGKRTWGPTRRQSLLAASMSTVACCDGLGKGVVGSMYALAGRLVVSGDAAAQEVDPLVPSVVEDVRQRLENSVTEFSLDNGMKFIVRTRRNAPVVSFHTYADVGAYDEEDGATGIAHLLEHLAFKGSPNVGSIRWKEESVLLDHMDDLFEEYLQMRDGERSVSRTSMVYQKKLLEELERLQQRASALSVPNAYGAMLQREGATGLNAATSHDSTQYYCSMPSNKMELWFALESERFQVPAFRDVYSEKKVVLEERRLRVDSSPLGAFQEAYAAASMSNNYRRPVIGYESDIDRIGRRDVSKFFKAKYGPESLTVVIVGDADPSKVRQYAEKYFGWWRRNITRTLQCNGVGIGTQNEGYDPLSIPENVSSNRTRQLDSVSRAGPLLLRSWYRPCIRDRSASLALDAIDDCLNGGRSSRLQEKLVKGSVALSVSTYSTFPGEKHSTQMLAYAIPSPGVSLSKVDGAIQAEVAKLVDYGPTEKELERYKKV